MEPLKDSDQHPFTKTQFLPLYTTPPEAAPRQPLTEDRTARRLEPVIGDVLPPIGSRVFILHGRDDAAHSCTVTGYYAWNDLQRDPHLHRVFVRLVYEGTDVEQARMLKDCYPTAEAALASGMTETTRLPADDTEGGEV